MSAQLRTIAEFDVERPPEFHSCRWRRRLRRFPNWANLIGGGSGDNGGDYEEDLRRRCSAKTCRWQGKLQTNRPPGRHTCQTRFSRVIPIRYLTARLSAANA